jgi:hypothetical protein
LLQLSYPLPVETHCISTFGGIIPHVQQPLLSLAQAEAEEASESPDDHRSTGHRLAMFVRRLLIVCIAGD